MITTAGIDFGNSNCVVAVPRGNGVDVILNQSSNRLTPTIVMYTNDRRYAGELASQNQMQFPQSAITDLKKLISLKYESETLEEISLSNPYEQFVKLDDGNVGIKVQYKNEEITLRPEQCISYLLKELHTLSGLEKIESFVITVNPWWSENQRRSILNAFKIAKIQCKCLLNSSTAAAIAYILQHRQRLPSPNQKSVNVAFVDIGGSAMTVAIAEVKQQSIQMKAVTYNEKVNGSKLTEIFENYLLQKVKEKYKIDPKDSPRAMLRFRQAVEKAKKILSVNPAYQFEVQSIMNVDVSFIVKREEFTELIKDVKNMLEQPIVEALQISKVKKEDIFELQLLGGTTRVVAIKNELTRIFGKEPKQSMNLDECFAIGSAYMAAHLSPKTQVPIVIRDITPHSITAHWGTNCQTTVFQRFNPIPFIKIIKVSVKKSCEVILQDENNEKIARIVINTDIEKETKVSLRIQITQSCTIEVNEGLYEKNGKSAEAEIKTFFYGDIDESLINKYIKIEEQMTKNDSIEKMIDEAKNDLESQIYSVRNLVDKNFYEFIDPAVVNDVKAKVTGIELWYEENEFDRLPLEEYASRSKELKNLTIPVVKRMNNYENSIAGVKTVEERGQSLIKKYGSETDPRIVKVMAHVTTFMKKMTDTKESMKYKDVPFNVEKNIAALNLISKNLETLKNAQKK